jgi:hypothetical protein
MDDRSGVLVENADRSILRASNALLGARDVGSFGPGLQVHDRPLRLLGGAAAPGGAGAPVASTVRRLVFWTGTIQKRIVIGSQA